MFCFIHLLLFSKFSAFSIFLIKSSLLIFCIFIILLLVSFPFASLWCWVSPFYACCLVSPSLRHINIIYLFAYLMQQIYSINLHYFICTKIIQGGYQTCLTSLSRAPLHVQLWKILKLKKDADRTS